MPDSDVIPPASSDTVGLASGSRIPWEILALAFAAAGLAGQVLGLFLQLDEEQQSSWGVALFGGSGTLDSAAPFLVLAALVLRPARATWAYAALLVWLATLVLSAVNAVRFT